MKTVFEIDGENESPQTESSKDKEKEKKSISGSSSISNMDDSSREIVILDPHCNELNNDLPILA